MSKQYDVIVVGSGASGGPLAARLSEDPERSVLLVEAGPTPDSTEKFPKELLDAGMMAGAMPGYWYNWGFIVNIRPGFKYSVARGRILGGSSTLNGTYFIRARKEDHERWAAAGNSEWAYEKALPYWKKLENDLQYGENEIHGNTGPVKIFRNTAETAHPLALALHNAAVELGFPLEPDKDDQAGTPGIGWLPRNAVNGVRLNTGITYVNPARNRENLTVLGDTFVRRVIFEKTHAIGIEITKTGKKSPTQIFGKEIILSAGAMKTPHILLLSGIGPEDELKNVGIPLVHHAPGVGKDFTDHADIAVTWHTKQKIGKLDTAFQNLVNWKATKHGYDGGDLEILFGVETTQIQILGTSPVKAMLRLLKHPLYLLNQFRQMNTGRTAKQGANLNVMMFAAAVQHEESRGQIRITNNDPQQTPDISYNYLSDERDIIRMRETIRTSAAILNSKAMQEWFAGYAEIDQATLDDDQKLDKWMIEHLGTAIHMCGTTKAGRESDGAVVDQYGRVYGVTGLRVADTSILPDAPLRGPAATAHWIGEFIADAIRAGK